MAHPRDSVPNIAAVLRLRDTLATVNDPQGIGELTATEDECKRLMEEIEKTSKEVGGDHWKSGRYRYAYVIKSLIGELRKVVNGTHGAVQEMPGKAGKPTAQSRM